MKNELLKKAVDVIEDSIEHNKGKVDLKDVGNAMYAAKLWHVPKIRDEGLIHLCKILGFKVVGRTVYK